MVEPGRKPPADKRLSMMDRQQALLEKQGFSKPAPASGLRSSQKKHGQSQAHYGGKQVAFFERQDRHLQRSGQRLNATASSRTAVPMDGDGGGGDGLDEPLDDSDGQRSSAAGSVVSRASSLHPSLAGSAVSLACSESTIGAGDNTAYWDFQHRAVRRTDLGHTCRECRLQFTNIGASPDESSRPAAAAMETIIAIATTVHVPYDRLPGLHAGEPITERRGARISSRYHAECFSGFADPRSQAGGSHHVGQLAGSQVRGAGAFCGGVLWWWRRPELPF
jgi:hypothetical protein